MGGEGRGTHQSEAESELNSQTVPSNAQMSVVLNTGGGGGVVVPFHFSVFALDGGAGRGRI